MARIAHCTVGEQRFAVDLNSLEGIERTDRLQLAPGEAGGAADSAEIGWLLGTEEDVPVLSLARLFRRSSEPLAVGTRGRGVVLVVGGAGAGRFGVLVDRIERMERPPEAIHPLPEAFLRLRVNGIRGIVQAAGELSLLLELKGLRGLGEGGAFGGDRKGFKDLKEREEIENGDHGTGRQAATRVLIADLLARDSGGRRVSIGFAAPQVAEVIEALPILAVPSASAHLPGMILWRDQPIPVLDLARRLSGSGQLLCFDLPAVRYVVVAVGAVHVAVPVGRDVRFEHLPLPARPLELPPDLEVPALLGGYDLSGSRLLIFNLLRSLELPDLA